MAGRIFSPATLKILKPKANVNFYDYSAKDNAGRDVELSKYKGSVVLVVNVASACGFTPQYKDLQELYEKYRSRDFEILAFPCNQFGAQESGTDAEILDFCTGRFGVTFPVFQKVDVNGAQAAPVFNFLKDAQPGVLGSKSIKWNFTKFLVGRDGAVIERFGSAINPQAIASQIEKALG